MGYCGTILFPGHHTGNTHITLQSKYVSANTALMPVSLLPRFYCDWVGLCLIVSWWLFFILYGLIEFVSIYFVTVLLSKCNSWRTVPLTVLTVGSTGHSDIVIERLRMSRNVTVGIVAKFTAGRLRIEVGMSHHGYHGSWSQALKVRNLAIIFEI
jgi:hypothetical protein